MKRYSPQNKLIAIVGPTASGKSDLALKLARKYHGVIICADSRQVYKKMDIGTNKPTRAERRLVPHYGLDLVDPDKPFTLADYLLYARQTLKTAWKAGQIPFVVGGTGLYVTALTEGYTLSGAKPNPALRASLEQKTTRQLAALLRRASMTVAKRTDISNRRRLIRAIEQAKSGGAQPNIHLPAYNFLTLGISIERVKLYERIDRRVDIMLRKGLIAEVKRLAKYYDSSLPAMSGIGYKQLGGYLRGVCSRAEAIELIKRDTRHYAKRQMTWFRKQPNIRWVTSVTSANKLIREFLER